jgi:hypothetical protein
MPPIFVRDLPGVSLKELAELIEPEGHAEVFLAERIHFPADIATNGIEVWDHEGTLSRTLPPIGAFAAFGDYLEFPPSLLARLEDSFVSDIYNRLLSRTRGPVKVVASATTISEVYPANVRRIEPGAIVAIANRVIPDGVVIDYGVQPGHFYLDLVAPEEHGSGHLPARVGDYCSAGLRFEMKGHRAPTVEEFFYRLECTNGMQGRHRGAQAQIKGTLDQWAVEYEHAAEVRFRSVEETIGAYYASRSVHVPKIEQALLRHAQERHLSSGALQYLLELVPEWFQDEHHHPLIDTDQFTLANFISNVALDSSKFPTTDRRKMEAMGGAVASDQSHRCPACASRLLN